jgi:hypothetical protein
VYRSSLTETIATEKVVLPGPAEIQEERRHINLLQQLEDGVRQDTRPFFTISSVPDP